MFVEAIVFLAAIIGVLLAIGAFVFHAVTRKADAQATSEALEQAVDEAAETALVEITKTCQSALDELNEKYQAMLFLYELLEEKKKDIDALGILVNEAAGLGLDIRVGEGGDVGAGVDVRVGDDEGDGVGDATEEIDDIEEGDLEEIQEIWEDGEEGEMMETAARRPASEAPAQRPLHPRHAEINALQEDGHSVAEIARRLDMGQGEVKLIIDLSGR